MEKLINYETVFIAKPFKTMKKQKEIYNKYFNLINQGAKVEKGKILGIKIMPYEVKRYKNGLYIQYVYKANKEFVLNLERNLRVDNDILKFLTLTEKEIKEY